MGGSNAQSGQGTVSPKLLNNPNVEIRKATAATPTDIAQEYRRLDLEDSLKQRQAEALAQFFQQSAQGLQNSMQAPQQPIGFGPGQSASPFTGLRGTIQFQPLSAPQAFSARPEL